MKYKKYFFSLILFFLSFNFYAQNSSQIELPEVTTIISTETLTVDEKSVPKFSDILEISENSGAVTIKLPKINESENNEINFDEKTEEKTVFVEGNVLGGFPNLFLTDFSIFEQNENSPMKIHFSYKNHFGYAFHSLNDAFFNKNLNFDFEKKIVNKKIICNFLGLYDFWENGLQNLTDNIHSANQNNIFGKIDFLYNLPYENHLGFNFYFQNYTHYSDVTNSTNFDEWVKKTNYISFSPDIFYFWENYNFYLKFNAMYDFDFFKKIYSRGQVDLDFSWKNDFINIFSKIGFIIGTNVNSDFVIPFSVGSNFLIPISFSNRKIDFSLEGGLSSQKINLSDYEKKYKFSVFTKMPSENSNWYGKIKLIFPIKNAFSINLNALYNQTYLQNGNWIPVYENSNLSNGFYGYEQKNQKIFTSSLGFSYFYEIFSFSANWKSNWLENPVLENAQELNLIFSVIDKKDKWGTELNCNFMFTGDEKTPFISLNGFFKLKDSIKLVFESEDLINLFSNKTRKFAGQYCSNGGSASFGVKFSF